jgi:hypothetical protein
LHLLRVEDALGGESSGDTRRGVAANPVSVRHTNLRGRRALYARKPHAERTSEPPQKNFQPRHGRRIRLPSRLKISTARRAKNSDITIRFMCNHSLHAWYARGILARARASLWTPCGSLVCRAAPVAGLAGVNLVGAVPAGTCHPGSCSGEQACKRCV